jgi:formate/nitrite transporter FocA (FNT family)
MDAFAPSGPPRFLSGVGFSLGVSRHITLGRLLRNWVVVYALVCLAVWLATGGRSVIDKIFAIVFPIAAFVAAGFEHSVANMYFLPLGLLLADGAQVASLDVDHAALNLLATTLGNVVGGAVLVGLVYWFVYLAPERTSRSRVI